MDQCLDAFVLDILLGASHRIHWNSIDDLALSPTSPHTLNQTSQPQSSGDTCMIWFFLVTSGIMVLLGTTFLIAPKKMLFLLEDTEQHRLMQGRFYPTVACLGGLLMIFVCAPINVAIGFLLVGVLNA